MSKPDWISESGVKYWFKDHKFELTNGGRGVRSTLIHRVNGPAVIYPNDGQKKWFLNHKELTKEEFNAIPMDQRNNY